LKKLKLGIGKYNKVYDENINKDDFLIFFIKYTFLQKKISLKKFQTKNINK
jgi:hypothetical protein